MHRSSRAPSSGLKAAGGRASFTAGSEPRNLVRSFEWLIDGSPVLREP